MISEEFISTIKAFLGHASVKAEKYLLPNTPPTEIIGYATFFRTFVIVITLFLVMMFWLKRNYKEISLNIDRELILIISLFLVGVGHTFAYAIYGHMSLRFIVLIYPIITVFMLEKINARKSIQVSFLVILVLLAFIQTGSFMIANYNKPNNLIYEVRPSFIWLINHAQHPAVILSDFQTSEVAMYYFKASGSSFIRYFYDSKIYGGGVVNSLSKDTSLQAIDYIIINTNMNSTPSVGWKAYEPLSKYLQKINNNPNINKIYENNFIQVFKT